MPKISLGTVIKLLAASLVVGMIMAYFEATPLDVFEALRDVARDSLGDAWAWAQWSVKYVLLGAVVVVPVWLVFYLFKAVKR